MNTGVSPAFSKETASTRSVPRYKLTVPLALSVLRSGVPSQIPGRAFEIGEGGLGVVPASQLLVGESVRVEFLVPHTSSPLRATALVRYRHERCFGLQFLRMPAEQQAIVRYWTRRQGDLLLTPPTDDATEATEEPLSRPDLNAPKRKSYIRIVAFAISMTLIGAVLGWWHWQQGWAELEVPQPPKETATMRPPLEVPPDAMLQRVVYRVIPEYPEPARQAGVQGTVVLDTVVSAEGAVTQTKFVSGPDVLSQAATDAVRQWRFEPYSVDGQAATVKTTVAINFRLEN